MREESSGRHFDVIVIGAGMAGASAAHDLHGAGKEEGLPDISLGEAFTTVMQAQGVTGEKKDTVEALTAIAIEMPLGASISKVSLYHFGDDLNAGTHDFAVPGGYVTGVEKLLEGISIELNSPVECVERTNDSVTMQTCDGRVFTSDYVIVTVSVGVLLDGSISFCPPLPAEKRAALRNLGMGHDDKYWFRFAEAFWLDLDQPRQNLFRLPAPPLEWLDFTDFTQICNVPMLLAFQGGKLTEKLESMSDEEVINCVMPALEWLFGDDAQRPVSVRRSRWVTYPWTLGAYSHLKPGGAPRDRVTLGEPAGRVRFAGEGTMLYFPHFVSRAGPD